MKTCTEFRRLLLDTFGFDIVLFWDPFDVLFTVLSALLLKHVCLN